MMKRRLIRKNRIKEKSKNNTLKETNPALMTGFFMPFCEILAGQPFLVGFLYQWHRTR